MDSSDRYVVVGQNGSPYSMKLRAVMRYRRLPFDWVLRTERNMGEFAAVKPLLMPMIRFPGEESGGLIQRRLSMLWSSAILASGLSFLIRPAGPSWPASLKTLPTNG